MATNNALNNNLANCSGLPIPGGVSATGTPSSSTFLRGDGTWATPVGAVTAAQVQQSAFNYGTDTGVANAYIVNLSPAITSLTDGLMIAFSPLNQNTISNPTLTVNGFAAGIVIGGGVGLQTGDVGYFGTGYVTFLIYNAAGSSWILLNPYVSLVTPQAIAGASYFSASDTGTGTTNNYITTLDQVPTISPGYGTMICFQPGSNNTGGVTVKVNGAGPYGLSLMNGAPVQAGAMITTKYAMIWFGTNLQGTLGWILLNPQYDSSATFQAQVSLTSAQVLALHTTSILCIAAVTGKVIAVTSIFGSLTYNTTTYTGTPATRLQYGSTAAAGGAPIATIPAAFFNAAVNQCTQAVLSATPFTRTASSGVAVYISAATAFTVGNSGIKFTINYNLITP